MSSPGSTGVVTGSVQRAGGVGLFEGLAEGEQAGFTERWADEKKADRQRRV